MRRLAEVRDLEVLAAWAAVHSGDPTHARDALVQLGGEGTPRVQEFCLGEIALARGTGVTATMNATADVLDLLFRLPADLGGLRGRRRRPPHRPPGREAVAAPAGRPGRGGGPGGGARSSAGESGGRVLAVAEAKIIEADPALHQERVEAERRRRYVSSSRTDEFGLRTVIARVEAGDAVWVEAIVARVAEILAPRYPDATADELRSIAFGWLARPAELLQLLLEHRDEQETLDLDAGRAAEDVRRPGPRRSRPTCSTRCARSTCRRWRPRRCSTSTCTRPPSKVPRRRRPGRGPRPGDADRAAGAAGPDPADGEAGARPVRPGPQHRLRAPRVPQGTGPPDHRRRLLALRHLDQPQRRLRPPDPLRRQRPTGSDRHPQLRPARPSTSPLEDPRRLPLQTMRRKAATSG